MLTPLKLSRCSEKSETSGKTLELHLRHSSHWEKRAYIPQYNKFADEVEEKAAGLEQHEVEFKAYQCFSGFRLGENTRFKESVSYAISTWCGLVPQLKKTTCGSGSSDWSLNLSENSTMSKVFSIKSLIQLPTLFAWLYFYFFCFVYWSVTYKLAGRLV